MTLVYRQAVRKDLDAIVQMLADDTLGATREDSSMPAAPPYQRAFDAIEQDSNQLLVVAEIKGQVAGCLQLSFLPGLSHKGAWRGQIEAVRVHKTLRGKGVGTGMINWAIEACSERDCRMVQLTSSQSRLDAQRFYKRLGFEASHVGMKLMLH